MSATKNISLFVPHVFPNFTQKYVSEAFAEVGDVDRVDFVAKQDRDGKQFNAAYIHFKRWYKNDFAFKIQDDITENGSTKFYHDDSEYYWIVLPNTAKKHVPGERKPRLDLGEAKSVSVKSVEKTPEKQVQKPVCPGAPKKPSYAQVADKANAHTPCNLDAKFEECLEVLLDPKFEECLEFLAKEAEMAEIQTELEAEMAKIEAEMEEIEADLEADDENLVSIDWRYVQAIEQENMGLHAEVAQLRMALINLDQMYQAEKAKVRAFSNVEASIDL